MTHDGFAGLGTAVAIGAGTVPYIDIIHKIVQIGSGFISIIAGAFAIYMYVQTIREKRRLKKNGGG